MLTFSSNRIFKAASAAYGRRRAGAVSLPVEPLESWHASAGRATVLFIYQDHFGRNARAANDGRTADPVGVRFHQIASGPVDFLILAHTVLYPYYHATLTGCSMDPFFSPVPPIGSSLPAGTPGRQVRLVALAFTVLSLSYAWFVYFSTKWLGPTKHEIPTYAQQPDR